MSTDAVKACGPATGKTRTRRGPNAHRRASTRAKILEACVQCLAQFGYGAASTPNVARMAKVSRGSLLHQFPSKAELMIATAAHLAEAPSIDEADPPQGGVLGGDRGASHGFLASLRSPETVALAEIIVASR